MIDARIQAILDRAIDICGDSRRVVPGSVFIARQGLRRHGLVGLEEAVERGAIAIIHDGLAEQAEKDRLETLDIDVIECVTLHQDLPQWLQSFWGYPQDALTLHAVTGTNGKSSIAWLLAQALDGAMIGTLGVGRVGQMHKASLTTPSLFCIYRHLAEFKNQGIRHVVIEASSHALVQGRLAGLTFETAIFTNLGHDHLDYHKDRLAYGEAKRLLFTDFEAKHQLINIDDAFGAQLFEDQIKAQDPLDSAHPSVIAYTIRHHQRAQAWASSTDAQSNPTLTLHVSTGQTFDLTPTLIGDMNHYNLLVCAEVMATQGIEIEHIKKRLNQATTPPGRMECVQLDASDQQRPMVVVDYAHSPDALRQALLTLRPLCSHRLWCVFGCGGDRDASKRAPMGRLAESLADAVVLTDDNPRHESSLAIVRDIQSGMRQPQRARVITDRAQAIDWVISQAQVGDWVLLAGKGHETEQVIGDVYHPLDDRACARSALMQWSVDHEEAC